MRESTTGVNTVERRLSERRLTESPIIRIGSKCNIKKLKPSKLQKIEFRGDARIRLRPTIDVYRHNNGDTANTGGIFLCSLRRRHVARRSSV